MQKLFLLAVFVLCLQACSTAQTNVRNLIDESDVERVAGTSIFISGETMQTSSQDDVRIFTLHHRPAEIVALSETVARAFGFLLVDEGLADYVLRIRRAVPDGGACVEGWSAAGEGAAFTSSVLTLGLLPAKRAQCLVVTAELFVVIGGEEQLLAEFDSNTGRVSIVAGVREVTRYRSSVQRSDELQALEASFGGLFQTMIREGAFD